MTPLPNNKGIFWPSGFPTKNGRILEADRSMLIPVSFMSVNELLVVQTGSSISDWNRVRDSRSFYRLQYAEKKWTPRAF